MKRIVSLFIYFSIYVLSAQITFNTLPSNKQLVARDQQTNLGIVTIIGEVNLGDNYNLEYDSWGTNEPNNSPTQEDAAEIINSSGEWNDADASETRSSYVEYNGSISVLSNFIYLGQYNGHSYFKNPSQLNWEASKQAAENAGGYLSSHHTAEENSTVAAFDYFRGWIGLYHDTTASNYSEPSFGWKWVAPIAYNNNPFSSINVELLRNGTLQQSYTQNLSYQNQIAPFSFDINITAELAKYRIKIYTVYNGSEELVKDVDDIVAGDVFVIQGQSNAAAVMYNGSASGYQSDYIRVYSGGNISSSGLLSNDSWYYGQGDGNENSSGNTGQWGLVLAKKLVDELNVPIAIFNAAHGGQPIGFFQAPTNYSSSTNTNYGRLYYRLNKTGLKNAVRGILWSQGEADSFTNGLSTNQYKNAFISLKNSWETDFINLSNIYIFQTRDCNCGTSSNGRLQIKEAQRLLAQENEDIFIMPTAGITSHSDYCHFPFVNGYESFANRIYKPLTRDLYGYNYSEEIDAPMIVSATFTNEQKLIIETSSAGLMTNTANINFLLNRVISDFVLSNANGVSISSFEIQGSSIIFNLTGDPGSNSSISFLGQYAGIENNITNNNGLELVCFSYFPITGGSENDNGNISEDIDKKSGLVFVEGGDGIPASGKIYASSARGASRDSNGNSNSAFGNIGEWAVDLIISQFNPTDAAGNFGNFTESGHPLYNLGDGSQSMSSAGFGALGWGSFGANAYNRSSGLGSVAMGFNTIAGPQDVQAGGIDGGNVGQFSAGYASRAIGNLSTATGFRNTASGGSSVALGNYNYATGDATIALGKENWAEGASTVAIGFKNHAAGGGSVALGQENIAWGTTNFTSGYQNKAGDTNASIGTAGSATAMGTGTKASGRSSFTSNNNTTASNHASAALGLSTTADNFGMLAIGVNNSAGVGDTSIDPDNYGGYYYADGAYTGTTAGVAFVIGNGDLDTSNGLAGNNPSNAFVVNYDGSATLSGDLTINSDARLKSNIISLGSTLAKLLMIDGKSYTMKTNESQSKIGLLAQDVQKAFPELVKTTNDSNQTLSVNYQGLIPILINAIKEQQKQIKELKNKIKSF
ncbi:MAG: tail fiber domain-containing protein [Polaribacter sp.]|uniref:tail fiber domain-containing protein n=1 Tax=Polaribacter sp. TaxID=1920175 RepID=UPI0038505302